jgi:hypothetical protein
MRLLLSISIAALVLQPVSVRADTKDCDGLRGTSTPFQIVYTSVTPPNGPAVTEQYHRSEGGVGRRLRRSHGQMQVTTIETRYAFATRVRSGATDTAITIEGIDLGIDHFAVGRDFTYTRRLRLADGSEQRDENVARLRGEETMTVSGCAFRVLVWEVERRRSDPRPGQPAATVEGFWYAPELRGFLRLQGRAAGQPIAFDVTATRLEARFEPLE